MPVKNSPTRTYKRRPTKSGRQASAATFRWDRIARIALLLVLLGIVSLYVEPIRTYFRAQHEAAAKRKEVTRLQREHNRLKAQLKALHDPRALEYEARKLGMVRPDERPYGIDGLSD